MIKSIIIDLPKEQWEKLDELAKGKRDFTEEHRHSSTIDDEDATPEKIIKGFIDDLTKTYPFDPEGSKLVREWFEKREGKDLFL